MVAQNLKNDLLNRDLDKVDMEDVIFAMITVAGAGAVCGFIELVVAGTNVLGTAFVLGSSTPISYGLLAIFGGLTGAVITNGFDRDDFDNLSPGEQGAIAVIVVGAIVYTLSPDFASAINGSLVLQFVYTSVHSLGILVIASE